MSKSLARHWFLFAMAATLCLALGGPEIFARATAWLQPRGVVVAALFLIAWTMPGRSLTEEVFRPWAALWAVLISYGFLPAAAWFFGPWLLADFHIGTLITVCGPCTLASAVLWTRLARGNEATALLVTVLSTASSWLITPAWLTLTTGAVVDLDPLEMMVDLLLSLVAPVALGQICRTWSPLYSVASRHKLTLGVVSQILILAILLRAAAQVGLQMHSGHHLTVAAVLAAAVFSLGLHFSALALGWWSGSWLGFDRPRRIAIAFACSQKTLPVALVVLEYYQNQYPLAVVSILFYHAGQLLFDTAIAERLGQGDGTGTGPGMVTDRFEYP